MPLYEAEFDDRRITYAATNYAHAAAKASWLVHSLGASLGIRIALKELDSMYTKLQAHHDAQEGTPCLEMMEDDLYCDVYVACRKLAKDFAGWSEDELNLLPLGEAI